MCPREVREEKLRKLYLQYSEQSKLPTEDGIAEVMTQFLHCHS